MSHQLREVYDINQLDLSKVCRSFGFPFPPYVNLNIRVDPKRNRKYNKTQDQSGDKSFYSKVKIFFIKNKGL